MKELELVPFAQLADRVIRPTLRCFKSMVWPVALPMVGALTLMTGMQHKLLQATQSGTFDAEFGVGLVATVFAILLLFGWSILSTSAISIVAVDVLQGKPVSFWRGLRRTFEPRVFLTMLLVILIVFCAMMLCVVPVFFVAPALFLVVPVVICENKYGMEAVWRSVELVRFNATGRWSDSGLLQAAGLLFVGYAISATVGMAVQLPFMIYQQYYIWDQTLSGQPPDMFQLTEDLSYIQMPVQAINVFAQTFGSFYWAVGAMVLYLELRRRREGQDLEAAIPRILGSQDGA